MLSSRIILTMATNQRGKLFSNFLALGVIQGTNFLLPLLVMPYVIKRIGADGFGIVAVAQVVMLYLSTFSDYGFNLTATRDISLHRHDNKKISKIFCTVLSTKLIITVLSFVILLVLVSVVPLFRDNFLLYILAFSCVLGQSLLTGWFFQGVEKMHYITFSTLIARLIFVVLVFMFIHNQEDKALFLFFLGIGNIIAGIISIYIAIKVFKLKIYRPSAGDIILELKEGWQITFSNLSINTYLYINVFVLRIFANDTIVGYYSIAEKIFYAIRQLLAIFSQAIYPRVCQIAIQKKEDLAHFFKQVFIPFLLLVCLGCISVFIFSSQLVHIFLSTNSDLSVLLLKMLSFVPVVVCLNIPAYLLLLAFNEKKIYMKIFTAGTIVNVFSNLLLASNWGAVGTATSIIISESFITIALLVSLYRKNLMHSINPRIL